MSKLIYLLLIYLILNIYYCYGFENLLNPFPLENDDFKNSFDIKFNTKKRNINETVDSSESFVFNGLEKYQSVPILFPKDICIFIIDKEKYVSSLYINNTGNQQFVIFKYQNNQYLNVFEIRVPLAVSMDCKSIDSKGFIALAFKLTELDSDATNGSPVIEISPSGIKFVQYFTEHAIIKVQFIVRGNHLYFLQIPYANESSDNTLIKCPIFKWTGTNFNQIDKIPCENAKHIEMFLINSQLFIAVANYADDDFEISSIIYHYNLDMKKFELHQKINTFAAVDVKYFNILQKNGKREHFLVFANSRENGNIESSAESYSVIYRYDDHYFIPFEKLLLYSVVQFLPVQNKNGEFILLISCENQDVKILEYNGWKFEDSAVQLTKGALSGGIANMRTFEDHNQTFIVIANENMLMNETNIYKPMFKKFIDIKSLKKEILEWSEKMLNKFTETDILKLKEELQKRIAQFENPINDVIEFNNGNITQAVVKKLNYLKKNMTSSLWDTLKMSYQAVKILEDKLNGTNTKLNSDINLTSNSSNNSNSPNQNIIEIKRNDTKNSKLQQFDTSENDTLFQLEHLKIKTLIVNDKIVVEEINNITVKDNLNFKKIIAKNIIILGEFQGPTKYRQSENGESDATDSGPTDTEPMDLPNIKYKTLKVKNLTVTGTLNEIDFNLIYLNSLKKFGNQIITAPMSIDSLKVHRIQTHNNVINALNTSKLVLINGGSFVIKQDIQFAGPVKAKSVQVNERMNNIHVYKGKLDVLLKSSDTPQTITGIKTFENVDVLQPITLEGKLVGKHFDKMSPIKVIDDDIVLEGNYTIIGDVTIENILSTNNLYDYSSNQNIKEVIKNAIELNSTEIPIEMNFTEPIVVENLNLSRINNIDVSEFIKTGTEEAQYIKGHKLFKNNLSIEKGFFEVFQINGFNIEELETQYLSKVADQNITHRFSIRKLTTPIIFSDQITLGSVSLSDVLTRNTEQTLSGNVEIQNLKCNNAEVTNLQTNESINNIKFENFFNLQKKEIYFKDFKEFHGNVSVKYLTIKNSINGIPMALVEPLLEQLGKSISFLGPIYFRNGMYVNKLYFNGTLNGISSDEFGKNWLLSETNQVFTAPQKFSSIFCEDNINVSTINKVKFDDLITNTYWLNRDEHIRMLNFGNTLNANGPALSTGTINNVAFNKEVLKKYSKDPQKVYHPITSKQNVKVSGDIKNCKYLNGVDLKTAEHIIKGDVKKIKVETAIFEYTPKFETFNSYYINDLLKQVWMGNEDTVLQGEYEFLYATFKGDIEINGLINYKDLQFLERNYFSLTADQNITTPIYITNEVILDKGLKAEYVNIEGKIIDMKSKKGLNMNDFVNNALTKSSDQIISGLYHIEEIQIAGNLNNVFINGLRLSDDVVRLDIPNYIKAKKIMNNVKINELFCEPKSKINDISIHDWIDNVVLIDKNYTIPGTTTIADFTVFNDILVYGMVNGILFNENNLLLNSKNQTINGNVHIITKSENNKKILPNTIKDLNVNSINGLDVNLFYENLIQNTHNKNINIDSVNLIFKNKLIMENFDGGHYFYDLNTTEYFENLKHQNYGGNIIKRTNEMHHLVQNIEDIIKDSHYYLSHFQHKQTIFMTIRKIINLKWHNFKYNINVLAILKGHSELSIEFYKWNVIAQKFIPHKGFRWNSLNEINSIVNISKVKLNNIDILVVQTFNNEKFQHSLYILNDDILENIYQFSSNFSQELITDKEQDICLISYSQLNPLISKLCLDLDQKSIKFKFVEKMSLLKGPVKKMISLKQCLLTLVQDALHIWNNNNLEEPSQRIPIYKPNNFVTVEFENNVYIAIYSKYNPQSLYKGSIEIYKSFNNSYFEHAKSLDVTSPIQIEFLKITETNDLLLYILTENILEPFIVYKFRGILEFEKILGPSSLPKGTSMNLFNTGTRNYFAAVQFSNGVALVETVINSN